LATELLLVLVVIAGWSNRVATPASVGWLVDVAVLWLMWLFFRLLEPVLSCADWLAWWWWWWWWWRLCGVGDRGGDANGDGVCVGDASRSAAPVCDDETPRENASALGALRLLERCNDGSGRDEKNRGIVCERGRSWLLELVMALPLELIDEVANVLVAAVLVLFESSWYSSNVSRSKLNDSLLLQTSHVSAECESANGGDVDAIGDGLLASGIGPRDGDDVLLNDSANVRAIDGEAGFCADRGESGGLCDVEPLIAMALVVVLVLVVELVDAAVAAVFVVCEVGIVDVVLVLPLPLLLLLLLLLLVVVVIVGSELVIGTGNALLVVLAIGSMLLVSHDDVAEQSSVLDMGGGKPVSGSIGTTNGGVGISCLLRSVALDISVLCCLCLGIGDEWVRVVVVVVVVVAVAVELVQLELGNAIGGANTNNGRGGVGVAVGSLHRALK
jgi:hypothetical protein